MKVFAEHLLYLAFINHKRLTTQHLSLLAFYALKYGYQKGFISYSDLMIAHQTPFIKWYNLPIIWMFRYFQTDAKGYIMHRGVPTKHWNKINEVATDLLNVPYYELKKRFKSSLIAKSPDKLPIPVSKIIGMDI